MTPPIIAVYIAGLFVKRLNATAAFYTILSGLVIGIPMFIMTQVTSFWADTLGLPNFQYLYFNMIMFVLGLIAMFVISALGPTPDREALREYTFTREDFDRDIARAGEGKSWYTDFRVQSAVLFALTIIIVGWFWV